MSIIRKSTITNFRNISCSGFRFLLTAGLGAVFLLFLLSVGCFAKGENNVSGNIEQKKMSMEEQWGVKVESLRTSAAGNLLDFRYRINDPDKALHLVDRKNKPYLIDQATGKVLAVPNTSKVGPLRQTVRYGKPKADRIYFVLFGNPGGLVKAGDQVTVVIGDFRAEGLIVE